jgi:hypothetical protein
MEARTARQCVVSGLQSTGESHILDFLEENGEVTEFVSTAKSVIQSLVENYFPTHNDSSGIDDFQRMFLTMEGNANSRKSKFFKIYFWGNINAFISFFIWVTVFPLKIYCRMFKNT